VVTPSVVCVAVGSEFVAPTNVRVNVAPVPVATFDPIATLAAASAEVVAVDGPVPVYPEESEPHGTEIVIPSEAFAPVIV
jgi:hypothetical protein